MHIDHELLESANCTDGKERISSRFLRASNPGLDVRAMRELLLPRVFFDAYPRRSSLTLEMDLVLGIRVLYHLNRLVKSGKRVSFVRE